MTKITLALAFLASLSFAQAQKLDISTHDQIILKLETTLPEIKEKKTRSSIFVRLADLYADRARLKLLKIEGKGCPECNDHAVDREKSIRYYNQALVTASPSEQSRILMQIAHLHSLSGKFDLSAEVFQKIIKNKKSYSPELLATAYLGLGEVYFKKGEYNKSESSLKMGLQLSKKTNHFGQYRLAWSYLNQGKDKLAKQTILNLLKQKQQMDSAFQKDVVRDLATFTAKTEVSASTIQSLIDQSSPEDRKSNLFYLGQECDRLGNTKGAILVWAFYSKLEDVHPDDAIDIQLRTAQSFLDQRSVSASLELYQTALSRLKNHRCADSARCEELGSRARKYIYNWIRKEKARPTLDLLTGVRLYTSFNSKDFEILNWGGHIARANRKAKLAAQYYHQAAEESAEQLRSSRSKQNEELANKMLEGALLAEIDVAEESQDIEVKEDAYNHYYKLNPNGSKRAEVLYQLAYIKYSQKKYQEAFRAFDSIVSKEKNVGAELRTQAADLALDSLVLAKNPTELIEQALQYAKILPKKRLEYFAISRRASINYSVDLFANGKANDSDAKESLKVIKKAEMIGASREEKIKVAKNKILIALRLNDLDTVDQAAVELLEIPNLSVEDKEYALERRLWVSEFKFDFKRAFRLAKITEQKYLEPDKKQLKLALLAELSGNNASAFYRQYFRLAKNTTEANLVRLKLIREAKYPWATLGLYQSQLLRTPEIHAEAIAVCFARYNNLKMLKKYADQNSLRRTRYYATLQRFIQIEEDKVFEREISRHRVIASSEKQMQRTLKERVRLLNKAEQIAKSYLRQKDFTLQLIALSRVSRENIRTYSDIMRLPLPSGLNPQQKLEYKKLLETQAEPYKSYAAQIDAEIAELLKSSQSYRDLQYIVQTESSEIRGLAVYELKQIRNLSSSIQRQVDRALARSPETPSRRELERAKLALIDSPFDRDKLQVLRKLENRRGSSSMVAFLDARLEQMNSERM